VPPRAPLTARAHSEVKVGGRLRAARLERGLTIDQLARASGLTKGFISQLERDATAASLSSLARICDALGIRIGALTDRDTPELVRRDERPRVDFTERHYHYLLSPPNERRFQAIESVIAPGGTAGDEPYTFPADAEFVYVLSGSLELRVGGESYVLEQGDGFTYSPREPHTWKNPSEDEPAVVLWVATPNPY
jgi:transcriptional regulator with XRE-family HTH domain